MEKLVAYINAELRPRRVTSDEALYEHMASQSNYSLSIVYKPFDATKRWHWVDHGRCLDYFAVCGGGDLLDIGPGDGWPSLPVAFHAHSVTGIDASPRRIAVCAENARRLGLTNFRGAVYTAGTLLPFPDGHFDGAMAASSIENSPDPRALLREVHRVLRSGGKLRLGYEEPSRYAGKDPRELHLWPLEGERTYLYLIDRHLAEERVDHYCLILRGRVEAVGNPADLGPRVLDAMTYSLSLPGCKTWLKWLHEAGFSAARATHDGGRYAAGIFSQLDPTGRPGDLAGVERLLLPGVRVVSELEAPLELDPLITAVK